MMPGPDRVIACPGCHFLSKQKTLLSGNTIGSALWTDGKRVAPMLPDQPSITRCPGCGNYFWLDEAKEVGEFYESRYSRKPPPVNWVKAPYRSLCAIFHQVFKRKSVPRKWLKAPYVKFLEVEEYLESLRSGAGSTREKEQTLRMLLWWAVNDYARGKDGAPGKLTVVSAALRENLEKLDALLSEENTEELLLKAEIARERGDFEQVRDLLRKERIPSNYQYAARRILSLAEKGDTTVGILF